MFKFSKLFFIFTCISNVFCSDFIIEESNGWTSLKLGDHEFLSNEYQEFEHYLKSNSDINVQSVPSSPNGRPLIIFTIPNKQLASFTIKSDSSDIKIKAPQGFRSNSLQLTAPSLELEADNEITANEIFLCEKKFPKSSFKGTAKVKLNIPAPIPLLRDQNLNNSQNSIQRQNTRVELQGLQNRYEPDDPREAWKVVECTWANYQLNDNNTVSVFSNPININPNPEKIGSKLSHLRNKNNNNNDNINKIEFHFIRNFNKLPKGEFTLYFNSPVGSNFAPGMEYMFFQFFSNNNFNIPQPFTNYSFKDNPKALKLFGYNNIM